MFDDEANITPIGELSGGYKKWGASGACRGGGALFDPVGKVGAKVGWSNDSAQSDSDTNTLSLSLPN